MSFPQDDIFLINMLRDNYLTASNNIIKKRVMKPYLSSNPCYNILAEHECKDKNGNINSTILKETKKHIDNLLSKAESPPIQSDFYSGIKAKKYDMILDDYDSENDSDHNDFQNPRIGNINNSYESTENKNTLTYKLDDKLKQSEEVRRVSIDSADTINMKRNSKAPSLVHKILKISEASEDDEISSLEIPKNNDSNSLNESTTLRHRSLRVSSSSSIATVNSLNQESVGNYSNKNLSSSISNNAKFPAFSKNTYRASIGKFFTKSQRLKSSNDSDSSDDEDEDEDFEQKVAEENDEVGNDTASLSSYEESKHTPNNNDEFIVDYNEISKSMNDLSNIDYEDDLEINSFDSSDNSLMDGSFTDGEDRADSITDIAFERANLYWKRNNGETYNDSSDYEFMKSRDSDADITNSIGESISSNNNRSFNKSPKIKRNQTKSKLPKPKSVSGLQDQKPHVSKYKASKPNKSVNYSNGSVPQKKNDIEYYYRPLEFKKVNVSSNVGKSAASKLTSFFNEIKTNEISPLEIYEGVSGENLSDRVSTTIEVYVQKSKKYSNKLFKVKVRKDITVLDLLGFILLSYGKAEPEETANKKYQDVDNWKLQLSDEGEIDEGFGILDKNKKISVYSPDEVSLIMINST